MESGNRTRPSSATAGSAHARDLGYLDKFLEKLRSEAAAMPRGDARTRLETLLREETDRWREIAALLDARPAETPASPPRPASRSPGGAPPASSPRPNPCVRPEWQPRVTVGSLKRSRG